MSRNIQTNKTPYGLFIPEREFSMTKSSKETYGYNQTHLCNVIGLRNIKGNQCIDFKTSHLGRDGKIVWNNHPNGLEKCTQSVFCKEHFNRLIQKFPTCKETEKSEPAAPIKKKGT